MRSFCRLIPAIFLSILAVSCQPVDPAVANAKLPQGPVTHMVVMWLYDRGDATARHEILAAGKKLATIDGVVSVRGGQVLPSERPMVDSTYDVGFVMTFRNEHDLHRYINDPIHVEIKKTLLDRYVREMKVYDFVSE